MGPLGPPGVNGRLVGRKRELARLQRLVGRSHGRFAVVCGPGGMGKSMLAAALAARFGGTVWWIRWRDQESLAADLTDALGLHRDDAGNVWDTMLERSRWLLVVDGVDQARDIMPTVERLTGHSRWLGNGRRLLLVTSRDTGAESWGADAELITLGRLPPRVATNGLLDFVDPTLFAGASRRERRRWATALATRLGGFPLALRIAGAAGPRFSVEDLAVLPSDPAEMLRVVVEHALELLTEDGYRLAGPVLRMVALCADAPLPCGVITAEFLAPVVAGEVSRTAIKKGLAGLRRFGLASTPGIPLRCVVLPRAVRESMAARLPDSGRDTVDRILLADAEAAADSGRAGWVRANLLAPHLVAIAGRIEAMTDAAADALATLARVADALDTAAMVSQMSLRRAILHAELTALGPEHPNIKFRRLHLGWALTDAGDHRQAAEVFGTVVAACERELGPRHIDTIRGRHNLAKALTKIGQHRRAVDILETLLPDYEHLLGARHFGTSVCRTNLGVALYYLGNYEEALGHYRRAYEDFDDLVGPDHPDTLTAHHNIANTLYRLGEYQQAAEIYQQVLTDRDRVLGPDHPHTRAVRADLANALKQSAS
jgi:tetratricopeptide (TPR) repeat protein